MRAKCRHLRPFPAGCHRQFKLGPGCQPFVPAVKACNQEDFAARSEIAPCAGTRSPRFGEGPMPLRLGAEAYFPSSRVAIFCAIVRLCVRRRTVGVAATQEPSPRSPRAYRTTSIPCGTPFRRRKAFGCPPCSPLACPMLTNPPTQNRSKRHPSDGIFLRSPVAIDRDAVDSLLLTSVVKKLGDMGILIADQFTGTPPRARIHTWLELGLGGRDLWENQS